jgi:hypothetical protein
MRPAKVATAAADGKTRGSKSVEKVPSKVPDD